MMVAIFVPAFVLPVLAIAMPLRRYWTATGGGSASWAALRGGARAAVTMKNLAGGHGKGCNFEDEDRFTNARCTAHQATFWGFLLCLASTVSGTVLHYGFGLEAPYGIFNLPKLLGVPGGVLLCLGTVWLAALKRRADPNLGVVAAWGGEMAFILLLFAAGASGLMLYAASGTALVAWLLPLHLGTVLTFFLLMPYSKMVHGF